MPAKLDQSKIAKALADSAVFGPSVAARANGISLASLNRYQRSLEPGSLLACEVQSFLNGHDESWDEAIRRALKAGINFLLRAAHELDPSNPAAVEAVTRSVTALSDIDLSIQVLQQRLEIKNATNT